MGYLEAIQEVVVKEFRNHNEYQAREWSKHHRGITPSDNRELLIAGVCLIAFILAGLFKFFLFYVAHL